MTSTDNEKDTNNGVDQPQETKTSQEQVESPDVPEQWEMMLPDSQQPMSLKKKQHDWLKKWIAKEVLIRQVGQEEWMPIQDYFFPENDKEPADTSDSVLHKLKTEIERLADEMEYTKTFTTNQKAQIDQLYKENREYKDDLIVKFKEAITKAVIEQLDFIDEKIASYNERKITQEEFISASSEFADDFRDVLQNRLDMTCFLPEPGEEVNLKKHKILRTNKTNDPSLHKKIAVAKRFGYENENGKIIRQAFVETYEYMKSPETLESDSKATSPEDTPVSDA